MSRDETKRLVRENVHGEPFARVPLAVQVTSEPPADSWSKTFNRLEERCDAATDATYPGSATSDSPLRVRPVSALSTFEVTGTSVGATPSCARMPVMRSWSMVP